MHPINNSFFGTGKIKVFFYDGSALATGYIVKQVGTTRYVVTNGIVTKTVSLASTNALATRLDGTASLGTPSDLVGFCTMTLTVASATKYIYKLTANSAVCSDGVYAWTLGTAAGTVYGITKHVLAPANTVAPVISGTAAHGNLMTATTGTWTGSPTFAYQWNRGGVAISGATASTYTTGVSDTATVLTCTVTGTNAGGVVSAISNSISIT